LPRSEFIYILNQSYAVLLVADLHPLTRGTGERRVSFAILSTVLIAGMATAIYMYGADKYSLLYYGDAGSHLVAARKLFDWKENPGWAQMGTVWLPLPHFLLMFPSLLDDLFFTGFAGLVISLPSLALTSVLIYGLLARVLLRIPGVDDRKASIAAIVGALLYGLNPNFLYLGITAMTETPFMLFLVGSVYFLLRWYEELESGKKYPPVRFLLISALFAIAATLCRYEGWLIPLFLICVALIATLIPLFRRGSVDTRFDWLRNMPIHAMAKTVTLILLTCVISFSGIAFWLVYNEITYGDPLEFANAQYYSAASQALNRPVREILYLQPTNVLQVYGITALMTFGPVLLVASLLGYIDHLRVRANRGVRRLVLLVSAVPPLFTLVTLLIGIGEMSYWFNSRFVILLAPLICLLVGIYLVRLPSAVVKRRLVLTATVFAIFTYYFAILPFGAVVTLADAVGGFRHGQTPDAVATGEKVSRLYDGSGYIMTVTGSAQEQRIMMSAGIGFARYDSIIESSTWKASFSRPWDHGIELIIISKDPDSDGESVVKYWITHRADLHSYYTQVHDSEFYEIWKLK